MLYLLLKYFPCFNYKDVKLCYFESNIFYTIEKRNHFPNYILLQIIIYSNHIVVVPAGI